MDQDRSRSKVTIQCSKRFDKVGQWTIWTFYAHLFKIIDLRNDLFQWPIGFTSNCAYCEVEFYSVAYNTLLRTEDAVTCNNT